MRHLCIHVPGRGNTGRQSNGDKKGAMHFLYALYCSLPKEGPQRQQSDAGGQCTETKKGLQWT